LCIDYRGGSCFIAAAHTFYIITTGKEWCLNEFLNKGSFPVFVAASICLLELCKVGNHVNAFAAKAHFGFGNPVSFGNGWVRFQFGKEGLAFGWFPQHAGGRENAVGAGECCSILLLFLILAQLDFKSILVVQLSVSIVPKGQCFQTFMLVSPLFSRLLTAKLLVHASIVMASFLALFRLTAEREFTSLQNGHALVFRRLIEWCQMMIH